MLAKLPMLHLWYIGMLAVDKVFGSVILSTMLEALITLEVQKCPSQLCHTSSILVPPKVAPPGAALLVLLLGVVATYTVSAPMMSKVCTIPLQHVESILVPDSLLICI